MRLKVNCLECGIECEIEYYSGNKTGFCSEECRKKKQRENISKWKKSPKGKECVKRYNNSEAGMKASRRYANSEKGKAVQARYVAKPESREKRRIHATEYYEENREEIIKKCKERYLEQKEKFDRLSDEDQLRLINKRSMEILNGRKKSKRN